MTTKQHQITDSQLVRSCRHSRLREAMMAHSPQTRIYRSTAALEAPTSMLSNESKFYAGVLLMSLVALLSHAIISITSF